MKNRFKYWLRNILLDVLGIDERLGDIEQQHESDISDLRREINSLENETSSLRGDIDDCQSSIREMENSL